MSKWSRDLFNYLYDYWHVRYFCDIWSQLTIVMSNKSQPRFHAEPCMAYFETTVAAAGASHKIADNIFCVPKGPLDTSR